MAKTSKQAMKLELTKLQSELDKTMETSKKCYEKFRKTQDMFEEAYRQENKHGFGTKEREELAEERAKLGKLAYELRGLGNKYDAAQMPILKEIHEKRKQLGWPYQFKNGIAYIE